MVVRVFLSLVWVRKTMASCISLLSLFFMMVLFVLEERVCIPSCEVFSMNPEDLRVMMVSDLLLRGSEAGFMDVYFRDFYMAKFFRKSFEKLKPDMLVVLGDVSAKGSELPNNKWLSVLQQLQRVLGPLFELPLHIVVGERDIGDCSNLDSDHVSQVCSSLPGLNSCGCGAFSVSNISFLSLNSIPMLCNKNNLRFGVEKFIEKESLELRVGEKSINEEASESKEWTKRLHEREIAVKYGSGPVLLLHFPLHRRTGSTCKCIETPERNYWDKFPHDNPSASENFEIFGSGAHKVLCTIPPNASEYILQALGPRIVFSAHTHEFCDCTHVDGTREVTIPSMTWVVTDHPGFVLATFGNNEEAVRLSHCSLARELYISSIHASVLTLLICMSLFALRPLHRSLSAR